MRNPLNNALFGKQWVNRALFLVCPVYRYTANSLCSRIFFRIRLMRFHPVQAIFVQKINK
jgi:hypothetical protein